MVPERQRQKCQKNDSRKGTVFVKMQTLHSSSVREGFHALTKVLTVSSLISVDEEEGVTRVDEAGATRTVRDTGALTVSSY